MIVLLWVLLAVCVGVLAVLVTPVHLHAYLHTDPRLTYRIDAGLFGGRAPNIRILDSCRSAKAKKKTKSANAKRYRTGWSPDATALLAAGPDLIARLLGAFKVEHVEIDVVFGLGDPADTGACYGTLTPFHYGLGLVRENVAIYPDFTQACFAGHADAVIRVTPINLITPLIRFAWAVFGVRS